MRGRMWVTGLLATAVTASLVTVGTSAAAPGPVATGDENRVTLITGDVVLAARTGDRWSAQLEAGTPGGAFRFTRQNGRHLDQYLLPERAAAMVASGKLDRELFNITGLIRQNYHDAGTGTIPLLLETGDGTSASAAPAGASVERVLPGYTAVDGDKAAAHLTWQSISGGPDAFSGGVRKIWLNARLQADLEQSVPQVGAPAAWQGGHTGKGVTVAVLDTGIDPAHPDVAGKIGATGNFTVEPDIKDGHGHGTHVASTVAGTGAASGGRFRGVAPDAGLAVGKVLDSFGNGQTDDVIAGLEWAAAEVGAKVVNLSLGGGPTDGTDPTSMTVNRLSREHGTLFVVAAGNAGEEETVSSPAAADAALAVGSVTKAGELSGFSSRGPRRLDGAVKPEIAAPGSSIVAARAAGTALGQPVDDHHTSASGTSMATPHTAGAAAILLQRHPDWTGEQLKAGLIGSAKPLPSLGAFAVGSGLLDAGKATTQAVQASPAVTNVPLPLGATEPVRRAVTYRNPGPAEVTLNLALDLADPDGSPAPPGLVALSADSVTVPAGGEAKVDLTVHPGDSPPNAHGGSLVASTADGSVSVRALIGVNKEKPRHDVTVNLLDRTGAVPGQSLLALVNLDDGEVHFGSAGRLGLLPEGRYGISGTFVTVDQEQRYSATVVTHPELTIDRPTELTLDGRLAKKVTVGLDQPGARSSWGMINTGHHIRDLGRSDTGYQHQWDPRFEEMFVHAHPGVSAPSFSYNVSSLFEELGVELFAESPERFEVDTWKLPGASLPEFTRLPVTHGGDGRDPSDVDGKLVVLRLPPALDPEEAYRRVDALHSAGAKAVALSEEGLPYLEKPAPLPLVGLAGHTGQLFEAAAERGGLEAGLALRESSRLRSSVLLSHPGRVPDSTTHEVAFADLAAVKTAYHGTGTDSAYARGFVDGGPIYFPGRPAPKSAERVEHFTPGTWELNRLSAALGDSWETVDLTAGRQHEVRWNAPVFGPGFAGEAPDTHVSTRPWAWRHAGALDLLVPLFADGAGHPRLADPEGGLDQGSTSLYRDGTLVGTDSRPGQGLFPVPEADAAYRLTADVTRTHPGWTTSTEVSGSWTFRSSSADEGRKLPLLAVGFAPETGLDNLVPAGRFTFPVRVTRQDGVPSVRHLGVDVSYDDGTTWQRAGLRRDRAGWTATVPNPATGFASLRAKAVDSDGNTVEQTIIRAMRIG
ncbi:S8 family serine peptidase [Amycolatopsis magusensis]|uniref:Subtilisin family serine protease n=1 Tax=Amycolatopsis magusensis TaxID=882444 RepID=A0ABS4PXX9_9PSEU|nr:S8 family serine peptidase [Amycolatopsis magusensis]MBP2184292.1 subtilisin family serine protease [Amycolatopsis magusensis]